MYYPPYDLEIRNCTTWLTESLTIGAQSFNQKNVGGPTPTGFTPAAIQWSVDNEGDEIGFLVVGQPASIRRLQKLKIVLAPTNRGPASIQCLAREVEFDISKGYERLKVHHCRIYVSQHSYDI